MIPVLHELPAEPPLDAEVAAGDVVVQRGGDLDDLIVLHAQLQGAADATVGADGVGLSLLRFVPGAGAAHVVFALEHERAGGADADAVAAVNAGGVGERAARLGRDAGVETAAGDGDGEGVLSVLAAGLDALVAEDALRVVADVQVVVDLRRLGDRGGLGAEALGARLVALHLPLDLLRDERQVDGRRQELEHELAAQADALGVGAHNHLRLDGARAGGHQDARALHFDDADAADVDRRQGLEVAQGRRVDLLGPAGLQDRRPFRHAHGRSVDRQLHLTPRGAGRPVAHAAPLFTAVTPRLRELPFGPTDVLIPTFTSASRVPPEGPLERGGPHLSWRPIPSCGALPLRPKDEYSPRRATARCSWALFYPATAPFALSARCTLVRYDVVIRTQSGQ